MKRIKKLISQLSIKALTYTTVLIVIIAIVLVMETESMIGVYLVAMWSLIMLAIGLIKASYK